MKSLFIIVLSLIALTSCDGRKEEKYSIYWQGDNLCLVMKRPTMGIIGPGVIDWRGTELDDVAESIYQECIQAERAGEANIWVRFETLHTDKYGNEAMSYEDHLIAKIPFSEARKYKSGKYLNTEYHLTMNIIKVAFGDSFPSITEEHKQTSVDNFLNPDTTNLSNYYDF